jgi:hypothetical protein
MSGMAPGGDPVTQIQARAASEIESALAGLGLAAESPQAGSYLVRLEGQRKLATMTWLIVGAHSLHVEAFFCRQPDEDHARFYRFLLERNGRMYGVHFAVDSSGDVYLVGRLPLSSVTADEIDRVLGCVLTYSDENFNPALAIGFASSIRKEWAWRVKRGESLANLRAFARCRVRPARGRQDLTRREIASAASWTDARPSSPPWRTASDTHAPRWSSSSPSATACSARVTAETWVSTSMQ